MMSRVISLLLMTVYCAQGFADALSQTRVSDSEVIAERGTVRLTLRDMDLVMEKVPAVDRAAVVAGSDRLQHMIDSELLNKQIAERGRELKLMESPVTQQLVARAAEQEFAKITVAQIVKNAKRPDFAVVAKEYYMANSAEFATPIISVVQHILISKTGRTAAEIQARAEEVFKKAQLPGAKFDDLVSEYSDDPSKTDNKGVMTVAEAGQFVPTFEAGAHALKTVGEISQVETEFGTHILRLVSKSAAGTKPFDLVRQEIISKLSDEFEEGIRTKLFSDLRSANPIFHEDVIEAVRTRYGELPKIGAEPVSSPTAPAADDSK